MSVQSKQFYQMFSEVISVFLQFIQQVKQLFNCTSTVEKITNFSVVVKIIVSTSVTFFYLPLLLSGEPVIASHVHLHTKISLIWLLANPFPLSAG